MTLRRAAAARDSRRSSFAPPTWRRLPSRERYPPRAPRHPPASPRLTLMHGRYCRHVTTEYSRHEFEQVASARDEAASRNCRLETRVRRGSDTGTHATRERSLDGGGAATREDVRRPNPQSSVSASLVADLLEIEGLFTQGSRTGRTVVESVGGILGMDCSDWSNGIRYRYHKFDADL